MSDPYRDSIQAFQDAASTEDPRSAAAFSTDAGFRSRADSAARLARQINRDGLRLKTTGPTFESPTDGTRVAVRCDVLDGEREVGAVFVLLVKVDGDWKVEGFAEHRTMVGLFLAGQHSPVVAFEDLPADSAVQAWAESEAERLSDDPSPDAKLARAADDGRTIIELVAVHTLEPLGRSAVVFQARRPGDEFGTESATVVQQVDGQLEVSSRGQLPSYEALFDGVQAVWDVAATEGGPAERADALLTGLFDQLLRLGGLGDLMPDGGARPILRFLSAEARAGRLPAADLLDPKALSGAWGGDLAGRIDQHVQSRVAEILGKHGIDPDAMAPDSPAGRALVEEHSDDIVRGLFQGVLLASAPVDAEPTVTASPGAAKWMRAALRHMADDA